MDNTSYIALSRQMALWKQMNIVSNNMANMNTVGYKQDNALFTSYVNQTENAVGIGLQPLFFTQDFGDYQDFIEGAFKETGNTFDLAIKGDGFFCVETKDGEKYTRKGQFTLDKDGALVTGAGEYVLSENNTPIFIAPDEHEIMISENGDVISENGVIARLKVAKFADNQKLLKVNGVLFDNVEGNAVTFNTDNIRIAQGMLESSNVNVVDEMVDMIAIQRAYDANQKVIKSIDETLATTVNLGKVQ